MTATDATDRRTTQQATSEAGDGAGTSTPAHQQDDVHYFKRSLNSTDSSINHACSWREMYAKMGVEAPDEQS
jgi:hypothetical protein